MNGDAPWQSSMCPILTVGESIGAAAAPSRVVAPPGMGHLPKRVQAITCQGPMCAFFVRRDDGQGNTVGGSCALNLSAVSLFHLAVATQKPAAPTTQN